MKRFNGLFFALLCAGAAAVVAEPLYVIEQLVVGVTSEPDGASSRVSTIRSGDRVEVLQHEDDQIQVRLASGEEGWVKASYLSSDPPLRQRLEERTQELEKIRQRNTQLEAELARAREDSTAPAAADSTPASALTPEIARPASVPIVSATPVVKETPIIAGFPKVSTEPRPVWHWVVGCGSAGLIAGFILGWRSLDRRIRRKYGGLRIY